MVPNDDLISGTQDEQEVVPEIVMFFLGPDGEPVEPGEPAPAPSLWEVYRAWRAEVDAERERDDYQRRQPVARQVQGTGRPGRHGYRDEIMVTTRSAPMQAVAEALRDDLFEPPLPGLVVDTATLRASRYELSWLAEITEWPWRTRRARLRLHPSPSLNVTVLSLSPLQPRRAATRRFLSVGLRAMNGLRDRIDERVAGPPAQLAASC